MDNTCAPMDISTISGMEISYKTPNRKLPANQKTPKDVSKMPNPVDRCVLGTMVLKADFMIDSCAPMPMPHKMTPIQTAVKVCIIKIK